MVSVVSLQAVLVLLGLVAVLNLALLALAVGHRRRIAATESAIEDHLETVAGTLGDALSEDVGGVEETVADLPDEVADVREGIVAIGDRLPEVERTLARLDGRLDGFSEGGLSALEDRISAVEEELDAVETGLGTVGDAVGEAGATLASLEDAIVALDDQLGRVAEAAAGSGSVEVADELAVLERRLSTIERVVRDLADAQRARNADAFDTGTGVDAGSVAGTSVEEEPGDMETWVNAVDNGGTETPSGDATVETAPEDELWADTTDEPGASTDDDGIGEPPSVEESSGEAGFDESDTAVADEVPPETSDGTESEDEFDLPGPDDTPDESGEGGGDGR